MLSHVVSCMTGSPFLACRIGSVQNMTINVYDLNAPRSFQLPPYGGMWYIFGAIGCGGVWMFSNGLILFVIILVWVRLRGRRRAQGMQPACTALASGLLAGRGSIGRGAAARAPAVHHRLAACMCAPLHRQLAGPLVEPLPPQPINGQAKTRAQHANPVSSSPQGARSACMWAVPQAQLNPQPQQRPPLLPMMSRPQWNIRSNKGLPPIIYRYMQKYRGW